MRRVQVPTPPSFIHFPAEDTKTSTPVRFEKQVAQYPGHIAVKTTAYSITYKTLNQQANQLARAIIDKIGRETEPIGLLFDPGLFQILGLIAGAKACKIWVPLDPHYPPARTQTILQQSGAKLILSDNKNWEQAVKLADNQIDLLNVENVAVSYSIDNLPFSPRAEDPAFIIYTSGSTGKPKGVVHSHFNTLSHLRAHTNILRLTPHDRVLQLATPNHISGISDIFRALYNGGTVSPYNLKEQGVDPLADWLISEKITVYHSVPTVFRHLVNTLTETKPFPDLRLIHTGGEPLSKHDVALFKTHFPDNCILLNNLGSTEASSYRQFFIDKETELPGGAVPVGYQTEGKPVILLDENGNEVGSGEIGEITLKSSVLATGYWGEPELTAKAFLPDPAGSTDRIYRTGDMGKLLPDGCLVHLGRKDAQVKIRGERVELLEVEAILFEHVDVKQTAVSLHHANNDPQLVAYVIPIDEKAYNPAALRDFLLERLPAFMVPSHFVQMDEMPLTPTGKVDRKALPSPALNKPTRLNHAQKPSTDTEQKLVSIWQSVLKQKQIGIHENFFDLGGHSLLAVQLFTQIEQQFDVNLPLTTLFKAGTIAQLARTIEQQEGKTAWPSLVALQTEGSQPPFFCVHGVTGDLLWFHELAQQLSPDIPFYGLQAHGLDGISTPLQSIEAIASHYIAEIQAVQEQGPYYLGGASFGGTVALEMAHQLQQAGHETALLVMFDHAPRDHSKKGSQNGQTAAFLKNVPRWTRNFAQLSPEQMQDRLQRKLRNLRKQTVGAGAQETAVNIIDYADELPQHRQALIEANHHASRNYQPKPYAGPVLLFQAQTRPLFNTADPSEEWKHLALGNFDVQHVPGSHEGIFQSPNVDELAKYLKLHMTKTVLAQ